MIGIVTSIIGFFSNLKDNIDLLKNIALVSLIVVLFFSVRACNNNSKRVEQERRRSAQNEKSIVTKAYEHNQTIRKAFVKDAVKANRTLERLTDSLNIKNRQINYWKNIAFSSKKTDTIEKYKEVYEFIELTPKFDKQFEKKFDECLTVRGEFTPQGLKIQADKSMEIIDLNYSIRRKLWGVSIFPRWGRKEVYQTLITSCNDTIVKNQRIDVQ